MVTPGILVSSEKVFEVGRDYHRRIHVSNRSARNGGKIRTGGTIWKLNSSLDIDDVLCRLGAGSILMVGERRLGV